MTKICHFILDHRIGGPHIYVDGIRQALRDTVESVVVTTGRGPMTDLSLLNLRHHHRALYPIEVLCNVLLLLWRFRRRGMRTRCVFDVHGAANLAPLLAARVLGLPAVWHLHETLATFRPFVKLGRMLMKGHRHRMVSVSRRALEEYGVSDGEVIAGAVDTEFWRPQMQRLPVEPDDLLRLIAVGNLNPLKGMDVLVDALARLEGPWELTLIGARLETHGDYFELLSSKVRRAQENGGKIVLAGWQAPEAVRALIERADIFVLPSLSEACPLSLLEAMAMARSCVACDVGDVRDMVGDNDAAIVVRPGDVNALLQGLRAARDLGHAGRLARGAAARQQVCSHYGLKAFATKHSAVYKALEEPAVHG